MIGLSAKNAILIVEFAKDLHAEGKERAGGRAGNRSSSFPSHSDDLAGLLFWAWCAVHRLRRQRCQPEEIGTGVFWG